MRNGARLALLREGAWLRLDLCEERAVNDARRAWTPRVPALNADGRRSCVSYRFSGQWQVRRTPRVPALNADARAPAFPTDSVGSGKCEREERVQ